MAAIAEPLCHSGIFGHQEIITGYTLAESADVIAQRDQNSVWPSLQARAARAEISIDKRRVRIQLADSDLPPWLLPVLESLVERWGARPGWNGYNAVPTSPHLAEKLLNLLLELMHDEFRSPQITPLADGGVQAEWHHGAADLEIVIAADEEPTYYYFNHASGKEEEESIRKTYPRAQSLIEQLSR